MASRHRRGCAADQRARRRPRIGAFSVGGGAARRTARDRAARAITLPTGTPRCAFWRHRPRVRLALTPRPRADAGGDATPAGAAKQPAHAVPTNAPCPQPRRPRRGGDRLRDARTARRRARHHAHATSSGRRHRDTGGRAAVMARYSARGDHFGSPVPRSSGGRGRTAPPSPPRTSRARPAVPRGTISMAELRERGPSCPVPGSRSSRCVVPCVRTLEKRAPVVMRWRVAGPMCWRAARGIEFDRDVAHDPLGTPALNAGGRAGGPDATDRCCAGRGGELALRVPPTGVSTPIPRILPTGARPVRARFGLGEDADHPPGVTYSSSTALPEAHDRRRKARRPWFVMVTDRRRPRPSRATLTASLSPVVAAKAIPPSSSSQPCPRASRIAGVPSHTVTPTSAA